MDQIAPIEHWICRRQAPRFRPGLPARLITLERHLTVVLENLSEGGANIALPVPHVFAVCVIKWLDFHAFAEASWIDGCVVGLQFSTPLSAEVLAETCRLAPPRPAQPARNPVGQRRG